MPNLRLVSAQLDVQNSKGRYTEKDRSVKGRGVEITMSSKPSVAVVGGLCKCCRVFASMQLASCWLLTQSSKKGDGGLVVPGSSASVDVNSVEYPQTCIVRGVRSLCWGRHGCCVMPSCLCRRFCR
eukprot:5375703-Amphidinium_carterae.1